MESSIVIKINFVDEFHFLCFEESIKFLCPIFCNIPFGVQIKKRIEILIIFVWFPEKIYECVHETLD